MKRESLLHCQNECVFCFYSLVNRKSFCIYPSQCAFFQSASSCVCSCEMAQVAKESIVKFFNAKGIQKSNVTIDDLALYYSENKLDVPAPGLDKIIMRLEIDNYWTGPYPSYDNLKAKVDKLNSYKGLPSSSELEKFAPSSLSSSRVFSDPLDFESSSDRVRDLFKTVSVNPPTGSAATSGNADVNGNRIKVNLALVAIRHSTTLLPVFAENSRKDNEEVNRAFDRIYSTWKTHRRTTDPVYKAVSLEAALGLWMICDDLKSLENITKRDREKLHTAQIGLVEAVAG